MAPVCTNDISLNQAVYIPFSYLNDSTCFTMRVSAIKSRHCIYHGRQCTVDRRSYSVLNMVRNFWNMCSTVEDDMWCITSIQLGITCHGSMTILNESNANERPLSPLFLTHTAGSSNPFSLGSLSPLLHPVNILVLITTALHTPKWFHYYSFLFLTLYFWLRFIFTTLTLLSVISHLLITWFISLLPFYPPLLLPIHGSPAASQSLLSYFLPLCTPHLWSSTSNLLFSLAFEPQYWGSSFILLANHSSSGFDRIRDRFTVQHMLIN